MHNTVVATTFKLKSSYNNIVSWDVRVGSVLMQWCLWLWICVLTWVIMTWS